MRNARQAIEAQSDRSAPGAITVSAHEDGDRVSIILQDNGPGIPDRLAERLFEPFVSGRASDGTGLGLTISRELALNHGGNLQLKATSALGTTFELQLPA